MRIGVIVRPKKTDALICQSLAKRYPLQILQYGVPRRQWISWVMKRLRTSGLWALVGHLGLSAAMKTEQAMERWTGKTIWNAHGIQTPAWVALPRRICQDEYSLKQQLEGVDLILALDAFRLPQSFFQGLNIPYLEIVWGDATKYLGDSSAFWEYAVGSRQSSMVSIVERTTYFDKVTVISQVPVETVTKQERMRSLKVKQAIALSRELPHLLETVMDRLERIRGVPARIQTVMQCYAPTLWTYLRYRFFGLRSLPAYACRLKEIMLKQL